MKYKFTLLVLILWTISKLSAQDVTQIWTQDYGITDGIASINTNAVDNNDNIYFVFEDETNWPPIYTLEARDVDGNEVYSVAIPTGSVGSVANIAVDNNNDFLYLVGVSDGYEPAQISRFQKSTGVFIEAFESGPISSYTISYDVAVAANGDMVVISADLDEGDYEVTKFSISGDLLWSNEFSIAGFPRAVAIHPTTNDIFVTGESLSPDSTSLITALLSISESGGLNWQVTDIPESPAQSILFSSDNHILIAGSTEVTGAQYLRKYDLEGNMVWVAQGDLNNTAFGLAEHPSGGYILGGGAVEDPLNSFVGDLSIAAYDNEGNYLWTYTEDTEDTYIYDVQILSDEKIIVVGPQYINEVKSGFISAYEADLSVSIDEVNFNNSFSIFPNPIKDMVNIEIENPTQTSLNYSITNMMGQKIMEGKLNSHLSNHSINLSGLAKGGYILSLNSDESTFSRKLVRE